jgi:hypothetical protein
MASDGARPRKNQSLRDETEGHLDAEKSESGLQGRTPRPSSIALDLSFALVCRFFLRLRFGHVLVPARKLECLPFNPRRNFSDDYLGGCSSPIDVPRVRPIAEA